MGKCILHLCGIHDQIKITYVYYLNTLHALVTNRKLGFVLLAANMRHYLIIF